MGNSYVKGWETDEDGTDTESGSSTSSGAVSELNIIRKFGFYYDKNGFAKVFAHGYCCNHGPSYANAGIGVYFGETHPLNISEVLLGKPTSNEAPIKAATTAILLLKNCAGIDKVRLYTSSEFLVQCVEVLFKGWRNNNWKWPTGNVPRNKESLMKLDEAMKNITVQFVWVERKSCKGQWESERLARIQARFYNGSQIKRCKPPQFFLDNRYGAGSQIKPHLPVVTPAFFLNKDGLATGEYKYLFRKIELKQTTGIGAGMSNTDILKFDFDYDQKGFVRVFVNGYCCISSPSYTSAGLGVYFGPNHPLNVSEPLVGKATIDEAEIKAATKAILIVKNFAGIDKLRIYTDSKFTVLCATDFLKRWKNNGWKLANGCTPENKESLTKMDQAMKDIIVEFELEGDLLCDGIFEAKRLARMHANKKGME